MALSPLMQEKLKRALNARRIALVGASTEQLSVGMGPIYNLLSAKFDGEIIPVNPKYDEISGYKCYPDLESIDPPPDVAALLLNQYAAVEMAERAGKCGVSAVVIVSGGFREVRSGGEELNRKLEEVALRYELPIIGPNTLGFSSFHQRLHAIFWNFEYYYPGPVAIISQSGGVGLTMAYSLRNLSCGLSHFIGVGNATVLGFQDYLQALQDASEIGSFLLFVEGVPKPRLLYEALKETARQKPVVVYKAGKNEAVSKATATHTGSLTGEYHLYRTMFKQAGAFEAGSSLEGAVAAKALAMLSPPRGNRLCAMTFTAGPCIVAMDVLVSGGWDLPGISFEAESKIKSIIGEKTPVEIQNPIDLTGPGFLPHNYIAVLETILKEDFDAYLIVWGNYNPFISAPVAELQEVIRRYPNKTIVISFLGHFQEFSTAMTELTAAGICAYLAPEDSAMALNALLARREFLKREELL